MRRPFAVCGTKAGAPSLQPPASASSSTRRGVDYCDGAGIALLIDLVAARASPAMSRSRNLKPAFEALLQQFDPQALEHDLDPPPPRRPADRRDRRIAAALGRDLRQQVVFIGEARGAWSRRRCIRRRSAGSDVWRICERVGADALPIVALISFLLGVILAFQSAVPMQRFGAEIFVADLIGLAMVRELGPLMTAILLAGRSGAAFAAEIGTMRVNQEVDALTTMGLDPVRFLVTPRVIAALLMMPLLTLFADLVGLLGGAMTHAVVRHSVRHVRQGSGRHRHVSDFMAGFVKSFVFAILIAGIGCLRGPADGRRRIGRRRRSDARRRFGHHPARRRRRYLRRHLFHARYLMTHAMAAKPNRSSACENLTAGYDDFVLLERRQLRRAARRGVRDSRRLRLRQEHAAEAHDRAVRRRWRAASSSTATTSSRRDGRRARGDPAQVRRHVPVAARCSAR